MITDDYEDDLAESIMNIISSLRPLAPTPAPTPQEQEQQQQQEQQQEQEQEQQQEQQQEQEEEDWRPEIGIDSVIDFLTSDYNTSNTTNTSITRTNMLYRPLSMPNIILPVQNRTYPSGIRNALNRSFMTSKPRYKNVLSKDGEASLKRVIYDPAIHKQDMCPITQTPFESGDEVTELPCNHYFETDAIEHWLKEEKAECPVCRMKLKHIEKTNADHAGHADHADHETSFVAERMMLYNSLSRITDAHPFGPRQGMEYFVGERDDNDLQTAIIASLLDA